MSRDEDEEFATRRVVSRQPSGWPSPAEDHAEQPLDVLDFVEKHPAATFYMEAASTAMTASGIYPHDVLVVDRSLLPTEGCVVVAAFEGEFVVRRYHLMRDGAALLADNPDFAPLHVRGDRELLVWGVVTHVIHAL